MTNWGGLNPALTSWREGINARYPNRGRASDGGYADKLHGSRSQHQSDEDGSVDAFDMDVNLFGSSNETGTARERQGVDALKLDFEADGRGHLWIHQREIAQHDAGPWTENYYGGDNPHDKHTHWESRQATERDGRPWSFRHTDALLRRFEEEDIMAVADDIAAKVVAGIRGVKTEVDPSTPAGAKGKLPDQSWLASLGYQDERGKFIRADIDALEKAVLQLVNQRTSALEAKLDQILAKLGSSS